MFLIQEKKINFLYIKLNTSCVRSAPHPLYSASCRCSSRAVASASHHLPPHPTAQHPSIQPFQSGLQSLVAPVLSPPAVCFCPFHSLFQSLAPMGADSPHIPSHPPQNTITVALSIVKSPLPGVFGNFFPVLSTSGKEMNSKATRWPYRDSINCESGGNWFLKMIFLHLNNLFYSNKVNYLLRPTDSSKTDRMWFILLGLDQLSDFHIQNLCWGVFGLISGSAVT